MTLRTFCVCFQFVDGWELNGSYFPNDQDYTKPIKERTREFCGKRKIKVILESSQNAALVRYQIPKSGRGFSFYFTTRKNPTRKFIRCFLFGKTLYANVFFYVGRSMLTRLTRAIQVGTRINLFHESVIRQLGVIK